MDNESKMGAVISVFIALLVGIILLGTLATQVNLRTDQGAYTASNEVITLTNGTRVSLANDWVTSVTSVAAQQYDNATGNITLVEDSNYTVHRLNSDDVAQILLIDADYDGNTSYVNYSYQDDNYVRHSQSRVILRLLIIFFVLGILATAIWGMYKMGILDVIGK